MFVELTTTVASFTEHISVLLTVSLFHSISVYALNQMGLSHW